MYDINWARRVYLDYAISNPRVKQIDQCVLQTLLEHVSLISYTEKDVRTALIGSIQGKYPPKLWRIYKRIVKSPYLDRKELIEFCRMFETSLNISRDEAKQVVFDF